MNKLLYFLVLLVFNSCFCFGQDTEISKAITLPNAVGFINDFAHILSEKETQTLDSIVQKLQKETTIEMVVVTLDTSMVKDISLETYTLQLARTWNIGVKGKNNGILIAVAPQLRNIRIENASGIGTYITDEETKKLITSHFVPWFKKGKYYEGIYEGITEYILLLHEKKDN